MRQAINDEYSINETIYINFNVNGLERINKISKLKVFYVKVVDQSGKEIYLMQNEYIELTNISSLLPTSYSNSFTLSGENLGKAVT